MARETWAPVARTLETWTPADAPPVVIPPDETTPPPVNAVLPQITGTVAAGSTIGGSDGIWTGSPTLARKWFLNGADTGVTTTNYSIPANAFSASILRRVTATNAGGSVTVDSVTVVTPAAPVTPTYSPSLDFSEPRNLVLRGALFP